MRKPLVALLLFAATCGSAHADPLLDRLIDTPAAQRSVVLGNVQSHITDGWLDAGLQSMFTSLVDKDPGRAVQIASAIDAAYDSRQGQISPRGRAASVLAMMLAEGQNSPALTAFGQEILAERKLVTYGGHIMSGYVGFSQHDPARIQSELELAEREHPESEAVRMGLAFAYLKMNRLDDARREFTMIVKRNPANKLAADALTNIDKPAGGPSVSGNPSALAHFNKAEELFQTQQYIPAQAEYRLAIAADPKFATAWVYLGDCYFSSGDKTQALDCYRKGVALDPSNFQAYRFMADVYERLFQETHQSSYLDKAIEALNNALRVNPSYAQAKADLERVQSEKAGHL
jgi:tetratricopeptide (TPR) repeat protein